MEDETNVYCFCGAFIDQKKSGRQRVYCSNACRKAAQRYRENTEQSVREANAHQEIRRRCQGFPLSVRNKLEDIERYYGVWAAYEASDLVESIKKVFWGSCCPLCLGPVENPDFLFCSACSGLVEGG